MRKLVYSMIVSADGYVADASGGIGWHVVDEQLHEYFNERDANFDTAIYGRRMYELMRYWDKVPEGEPDWVKAYAPAWQAKKKLVFSRTLTTVGPNATLMSEELLKAVAKIKASDGGPIDVAGPTIAAPLIAAGMIDEFGLYVTPVVLGGGLSFWPKGQKPMGLKFLDAMRFASGVVELTYAKG